jgi:hypothetical protein
MKTHFRHIGCIFNRNSAYVRRAGLRRSAKRVRSYSLEAAQSGDAIARMIWSGTDTDELQNGSSQAASSAHGRDREVE